jgi:hypothetical protein
LTCLHAQHFISSTVISRGEKKGSGVTYAGRIPAAEEGRIYFLAERLFPIVPAYEICMNCSAIQKPSIFFICFCGMLNAGDIQGNYYADVNREIFLLPKSASMAGSDMAISRSASPLSNPACLPSDSVKEISLAYAGYFQNTYSTCALSYIGSVDRLSCIGVSANYILVPDINISPDTAHPFQETATSSDLFFRISYGRQLLRFGKLFNLNAQYTLDAGVALNAERLNLLGWTGYGIGADAGLDFSLYYKEWGSNISAAMVIDNLTTDFTHWSSAYKEYAYPHIRFGLGLQQDLPYIYGNLCVSYLSPDLLTNEGINQYGSESLDQNSTVESPAIQQVRTHPDMLFLNSRLGVEYTVMNTISFRAGINISDGTVSFGGGLHLFHNHAGFDFAYLDQDLASTYKISVNYKWF